MNFLRWMDQAAARMRSAMTPSEHDDAIDDQDGRRWHRDGRCRQLPPPPAPPPAPPAVPPPVLAALFLPPPELPLLPDMAALPVVDVGVCGVGTPPVTVLLSVDPVGGAVVDVWAKAAELANAAAAAISANVFMSFPPGFLLVACRQPAQAQLVPGGAELHALQCGKRKVMFGMHIAKWCRAA